MKGREEITSLAGEKMINIITSLQKTKHYYLLSETKHLNLGAHIDNVLHTVGWGAHMV